MWTGCDSTCERTAGLDVPYRKIESTIPCHDDGDGDDDDDDDDTDDDDDDDDDDDEDEDDGEE